MKIRKLVIGALMVLIGCVNIDGVEAAVNDVTIEEDGTLLCLYCFNDLGISVGQLDTKDTNLTGLSKVVVETQDFAVINDNGGRACPGGYWYILRKRADAIASQALQSFDTGSCNEYDKVTATQYNKQLTVKVIGQELTPFKANFK